MPEAITILCAIVGAVVGAIVGSFLGVVAGRWPQRRSVIHGRSACEACGRTLAWFDLIPVVSWMGTRGRCRTCGAPIGIDALLAEVLGAIVGGTACLASDVPGWSVAVLGWLLLVIALLDARHMWLPLPLTIGLAIAGLGLATYQALVGDDAAILVQALAGAFVGWAPLALLATSYRRWRGREGLGGGDPLLLGAIGLWLGPLGVIHCLLAAALAGLAWAALLSVRTRRHGAEGMTAQSALPFGTFLALAAWPLYVIG